MMIENLKLKTYAHNALCRGHSLMGSQVMLSI
jgi:hypothetical protein